MNRHIIFNLGAVTIMGLALLPDSAVSQQKSVREQLIGSWAIVSNDNVAPDGTKRQIFGPNPKGLFVLGADGRYVLVVVNPAPNLRGHLDWMARRKKTKQPLPEPLRHLALGRWTNRRTLSSRASKATFFRTPKAGRCRSGSGRKLKAA
jgi:hypothetical protein